MHNKITPRRLSRCLAVQGIFSIKINQSSITEIEDFLSETNNENYNRADYTLMHELIENTLANFDTNLARYTPYLTRQIDEINLTEKVILAMAAHELINSLNIPSTIIINEAVELTKLFGAEDSYKFVNGLVDKFAKEIRANEVNNYSLPKKPKK